MIASGVPVGPGSLDTGTQGGTNNPISVDITPFDSADNPSCLSMYVNSVLIESIEVNSSGTYTFTPYSINSADCVWFIYSQGVCLITLGTCYTITYENSPTAPVPPPPSELYVRYVDSSNVQVTVQIMGGIVTVDNGDGTSTGAICVYGSNPPVCVQDNGINPPIVVSCSPYSWSTVFASCTSAFDCVSFTPL